MCQLTRVCSCSLAGKDSFNCTLYHFVIPCRRQENTVLLGRQCGLFPVTLPIWKRWQNARCSGKKDLVVMLSRHRWAMAGHPRPPANTQFSSGSHRFSWSMCLHRGRVVQFQEVALLNSGQIWMVQNQGKNFWYYFQVTILRLISGQVCKNWECQWKSFWPVQGDVRWKKPRGLYCSIFISEMFINIRMSCVWHHHHL